MSSEITINGASAAKQDNGSGTPLLNTLQNEIVVQSKTVPEIPNQIDINTEKNEDIKTEGKMEAASEPNKEELSIKENKTEPVNSVLEVIPDKTEISTNEVQTVKENSELSIQPKENDEKSVPVDNLNKTIVDTLNQESLNKENADIKSNEVNIKENKVSDSNSTSEIKQVETKEENNDKEEEMEPIDVSKLTEQILNMLNDGKTDSVLTVPELLKKNVELQEFIVKLIQVLKEKTNVSANLERQNAALIGQAQSLKDVISITKDLLGIRNMEVEHLHADMSSMEERIKEERIRHNTAVERLNQAMSLNDKLKAEYLVQMDLFQKLRDKYNEKVVMLTKENQRLLEIVKSNGLENTVTQSSEAIECNNANIENGSAVEEMNEENVDK